MRRRLLLSYALLAGLLVIGLGVPLAASQMVIDQHHLVIARLNDTARLAAVATPALQRGTAARDLYELVDDYHRRTGVTVVVTDRAGGVVLSRPPGVRIDKQEWRRVLRRALAGERSELQHYPVNLSTEPMFLAEPVEADRAVVGALVTISPTGVLYSRALTRLGALTLVAAATLAATWLVALLWTRRILRPVRSLNHAAGAIAAGRYEVRVPTDVGPPEMRAMVYAFNAMADRLVTLLRAQRNFVADASHQLRNPLAAVRGRVENLEPLVARDARVEVTKAVAEVDRLSKILDSLLTLAGAQGRTVTAAGVDASAVARQRVEAWRIVADERGVRLDVAASGQAPASCAPDTLDQVLDVLLDNAIRLSPDRGVVRVRTAVDRAGVAIHVTDQGPGMTAQDKARATDRFWRGSAGANSEGSGLGLAIAAALLSATGGSITFQDAVPRGLDVVVRLPRWRERS